MRRTILSRTGAVLLSVGLGVAVAGGLAGCRKPPPAEEPVAEAPVEVPVAEEPAPEEETPEEEPAAIVFPTTAQEYATAFIQAVLKGDHDTAAQYAVKTNPMSGVDFVSTAIMALKADGDTEAYTIDKCVEQGADMVCSFKDNRPEPAFPSMGVFVATKALGGPGAITMVHPTADSPA